MGNNGNLKGEFGEGSELKACDLGDIDMKKEEGEEQQQQHLDEEEEEAKKAALLNEELQKDDRMRNFVVEMTEEDKDLISCDEVFSLYLRHVSKIVNENYYRTVVRFVLLYRECLNEYGWLKRREHYSKAYQGERGGCLDDHDEVLSKLKKSELLEEEQENERMKAFLESKRKNKKTLRFMPEEKENSKEREEVEKPEDTKMEEQPLTDAHKVEAGEEEPK